MSVKVKKVIEAEIKSQQALLKLLISQEQNYGADHSKEKAEIENIIAYNTKIIKDAA